MFPAAGPLVAVDDLELPIEVACKIETILEHFTELVGDVDGFLNGGFLAVGCWFFRGELCDHGGFPFRWCWGLRWRWWCRI